MEDEHVKEDIGRLREIAQQGSFQHSLHILPIVTNANDQSMDVFHEIMFNDDNRERDFKGMVEDLIQTIEKKLADAEYKMFDATYEFIKKKKTSHKILFFFPLYF